MLMAKPRERDRNGPSINGWSPYPCLSGWSSAWVLEFIFKLHCNTQFQCSMLLFRASNHISSSIKLTITKWRFLCPLTFLFSKMGGGNLYWYVGQHKYLAREEIDGLSKSYVHSLGKNHMTASEQLMLLMSCIISLASWKLKTSNLFKIGHAYPLI